MQLKTTILIVTIAGFGTGAAVFNRVHRPAPKIVLDHAPELVTRRAANLSANICGRVTAHALTGDHALEFRLNDGPWQGMTHDALARNPRTPDDRFSIELLQRDLEVGPNTLEMRTGDITRTTSFTYSDQPPVLPTTVQWSADSALDVQDGRWQVLPAGGVGGAVAAGSDAESIVRPVPGTEGYDRILNVTGAFAGARRVELDATFRKATHPGALFGFGVLPLWGGHVDDDPAALPRRGWNYGIAWHYSKQGGASVEFSSKVGAGDYVAATASEKGVLRAGARYHIVSEAYPVDGFWHLRLKWWEDGAAEPPYWIELTDRAGHLSVEDEFAVALVAHRCQVEFGSVQVSRPDAASTLAMR